MKVHNDKMQRVLVPTKGNHVRVIAICSWRAVFGHSCLAIAARMRQVAAFPSVLLWEFSPQSTDLQDIFQVNAAKSPGYKAKLHNRNYRYCAS